MEDAVEHVLDIYDLDNSTRNKRLARRAVLQAYRDLPNKRTWAYYYRHRIIKTNAAYSTGTIAYDHSGGSSERLVTLTSGTFPSWTARGKLVIGDVHYDVETNPSTTTLTLTANSNPGADVASGTAYELYQSAYTLPADFRKIGRLFDQSQNRQIPILSALEQQASEGSFYKNTATPLFAAIKNDGDYYGNMSLVFTPPPDTAVTYDLMYEARPRELAIENYSTGTVSVSASSTTVTGLSTVFASTHVGAVIRFSSDGTNLPTSLVGVRASNLLNPFYAQRIVQTVATTTSLTIDAALPGAVSAVKYVISDPIDIEANAMFTAFLRAAELEMARLTTRNDVAVREAFARQALIAAMEADERNPGGGVVPYNPFYRPTVTTVG